MEDRPITVDVEKKFVRLTEERADGLVEFEFSIGDPDLFVEMLLPKAAYQEFCRVNRVVVLQGERGGVEQGGDWAWSLHEATHQRFRQG
ncbi:MAG: phenol hydroxylase [Zoogloea sp.]|nr:phenol hydroxylase [Zoogloea sp.]